MEDKIREYFICSNRLNKTEHFLHYPMLLSCGHGVCAQCITTTSVKIGDDDMIVHECGICGRYNPSQSLVKYELVDILMNQNLHQLFTILSEKLKVSFNKCKQEVSSFDGKADTSIELAKNDVTARIKSLKSQLDAIGSQMISELDQLKDKYKNWKQENESQFREFNEVLKNSDFQELEKNLSNKSNLTHNYLYLWQQKLDLLDETTAKCLKMSPVVKFQVSSGCGITQNNVGEIVHNLFNDKIKNEKEKNQTNGKNMNGHSNGHLNKRQ